MVAVSIQQMADRVAALLGEKYRVTGDLTARADKARRRMPARVHAAIIRLAVAADMARNPRLLPQVDMGAVAGAYDLALKHLRDVDAKDRRKGLVVGVAGSIAFSILVVAVLLVVVLRWRGFL